jgi:hypothetical protein
MLITTKHATVMGFEGTGIFSSSYHWLYKKEYPDHRTFLVINNHIPQNVEAFTLTEDQYKKYKKNKLSLVASGHCSVSGGETVHGRVLWFGEFKSQKHLKEVIETAEKLIVI